MARTPKPWYRADRKVWCVTINGKRHNLGGDKKAALRRFYAMMREPRRKRVVCSDTLPLIVDAFLDWTLRSRSAATFKWYRDSLQSFVTRYPALSVDELLPHHVETWAAVGGENVNTRRNRMRAVKRCLRWALGQGYLDHNPIAGLEIPAARPRDQVVPRAEFDRLMSFVVHPGFADLLRVTYETGCRPQESLRVEARHLDLDHARWVFPRSEAKGRSMPRAIYLSDHAVETSRRLAKEHPLGPLFRTADGKPWNPYSISCAFGRLQVRMGGAEMGRTSETIDEQTIAEFTKTLRPTRTSKGQEIDKTPAELRCEAKRKLTHQRAKQFAPRYSLYVLRHSWATNALQSGVDALTVAILMGHKDPSTLARTYQHLSHNPEHLLDQARRVRG